MLEQLFGGLHSGADLYPADEVVPPGISSAQEKQVERRRDADVAAGRRRRRAARARQEGDDDRRTARSSRRSSPGFPAAGKLVPTDVHRRRSTASPVRSPADVFARDGRQAGRDDVPLHGPAERACTAVVPLTTVAAAAGSKRGVVGVLLAPSEKIQLPVRVSIDAARRRRARRPASPSRSTCCSSSGATSTAATRSRRPARSSSNGGVGPIGGIKQKTIGAREAGVDVFLVPVGECGRGPQVRTRSAHHPCEEFSTGVARAGNLAASSARNLGISGLSERRGNCAFSLRASP